MYRALIVGLMCILAVSCSRKEEELPVLSIEQENQAFKRYLQRLDTDRDGTITCKDAVARRAVTFKMLDKDENGQLDAGEYRFAKFEDQAFRFVDLSEIDTDQSLTISSAEFSSVPMTSFLVIDQNNDCLASREEILFAARRQMEKSVLRGSRLGLREKETSRSKGPGVEEIDDLDPKKEKSKDPPERSIP